VAVGHADQGLIAPRATVLAEVMRNGCGRPFRLPMSTKY
jgi:hypothetical protein